MTRGIRDAIGRTTQVSDSLCALGVMLVTFAAVNMGRMPGGLDEFLAVRLTVRNLAFGVLLIVIWRSCFALCGLYRIGPQESVVVRALRIVLACTLATSVISLFTLASASGSFGPRVVVAFWFAGIAAELLVRGAIGYAAHYAEKRGVKTRHAVIVGSGPRALRLFQSIQARQPSNCAVIGFVDSIEGRGVPPEVASRLLVASSQINATSLFDGKFIWTFSTMSPMSSA